MRNKTFATLALLAASSVFVSAEEFSINPTVEVQAEVNKYNGGDPVVKRQIEEAEKKHLILEQYDPRLKAMTDSFALTLDKLSLPKEIVIAMGYPTTITCFDVNGNPWPVLMFSNGNKEKFTIVHGDGKEGGNGLDHILDINTGALAGRAGLKVYFKGLDQAVEITLLVGLKSYHNNINIILPVENPDAPKIEKPSITSAQFVMNAHDPIARQLLDGVLIETAIYLETETKSFSGEEINTQGDVAIIIGDSLYFKTQLTNPSPAPESITPGPHGFYVYKFLQKHRTVSGFAKLTRRYMVYFKKPDSMNGFRHFNKEQE